MSFYTPLRYPGSKRRLSYFVGRLLETNCLWNVQYVEPFAGGASVGLALLYEEYAASVHFNDLSRPVYAFWHTALHATEELCSRIEHTEVTIDEWHRQRGVYENSESAELPDLGFAAFFLNRANRSGIISGGVIGGKGQAGRWKVDVRYNKDDLIRRVRQISRYRSRIHVYREDALDFTKNVVAKLNGNVLAFYDPPYIDKGHSLYLNNYGIDDHRRLESQVKQLNQPWIVTYDYYAAVKSGLFPRQRRMSFDLSYSVQSRHQGKEVMFFSDQLKLPADIDKENVNIRMSAASSEHPVYGRLE